MSALMTKRGTADYVAMSEKWVQRNRVALGGYVVGGRLRFRRELVDRYLERNKLARRPGAPSRR
jgi:hypothetical protein